MKLVDRRTKTSERLEPNREMIADLYREGYSAAWLAKLFAVSDKTMLDFLRKYEIHVPQRRPSGRYNARWQGGKYQNDEGYVIVKVESSDPMHTMADSRSRILEHRYVMAHHLGRPLYTHEQVHHINDKRNDNRIENLELRIGPHGSGVIACCGDCGSNHIVYLPIGVNRG